MTEPLSSHLSPQAKKRYLLGREDERGVAVVELAPSADAEALRARVERLGGDVRSFVASTRLMNVEIPVRRLAELACAAGVVSVGVAERYSV